MIGVDKILSLIEKRKSERNKRFLARQQRMKNTRLLEDSVELMSSTDNESENNSAGRDIENLEKTENNEVHVGEVRKRKRGRKTIITTDLAAALDRTKVSDRKAVFVLSETAKSLGLRIHEYNINKDSIRRQRMLERTKKYEKIKTKFQSNTTFVIHWDGKLIYDLTGKEKIDRLPILVSGKGISQLLTVAKIPSATGEAQAAAVFEAIQDWVIADNIRAMCFDTTCSNTGHNSGACILIEQKLKKELLSLACRHHIIELIISTVFEICMGVKPSPEVALFKRFQEYWSSIDK